MQIYKLVNVLIDFLFLITCSIIQYRTIRKEKDEKTVLFKAIDTFPVLNKEDENYTFSSQNSDAEQCVRRGPAPVDRLPYDGRIHWNTVINGNRYRYMFYIAYFAVPYNIANTIVSYFFHFEIYSDLFYSCFVTVCLVLSLGLYRFKKVSLFAWMTQFIFSLFWEFNTFFKETDDVTIGITIFTGIIAFCILFLPIYVYMFLHRAAQFNR